MRMTREAYAKIIAEDIAWCEAQPRTLERDHTIAVLRYAVAAEYPRPLTGHAAQRWAVDMLEKLPLGYPTDDPNTCMWGIADALIAASRGEYPEVEP